MVIKAGVGMVKLLVEWMDMPGACSSNYMPVSENPFNTTSCDWNVS
jgi:hypothetical protein